MKINGENVLQEFRHNGLFPPQNLEVDFSPSAKQWEVWKSLQANSCDLCGGEITRVSVEGSRIQKPVCANCGNDNIPQIVLCGGAGGGGKSSALDSYVATPNGWVKFGDLKLGDEICSTRYSGVQRVIHLHPMETHEFYRLYFEDGTTSECSEGHLWSVWQTGKRNQKVMIPDEDGVIRCHNIREAREIYEWMERKKGGMYKSANLKIPLTDPVQFTKYEDDSYRVIPPYLMGVILGDGCVTETNMSVNHITICNGDKFVVDRVLDICDSMGWEYRCHYQNSKNMWGISVKSKDAANFIHKVGLYGTRSYSKFIPDVYKFAPIDKRFELMCGLMDTDGYIDTRGHMEYNSASERLSNDVAHVVRSLGSYATVTVKEKTPYKHNGEVKYGLPSHRVYIRSPHSTKMVSLPRKLERCRDEFNGGKSPFGKVIVDIKPIGKKESRCITVSDGWGEYLTDDFNVTHNSFLGCNWIAMSCIQFPGIRAVIARRTLKSLNESTWNTLLNVINSWGLIDGVNYKTNDNLGTLTFWNGSIIIKKELEFRPSDRDFQRLGSSEYTIAFIDEVGEMVEDAVEVLYSRLRWKVYDTFKVPKLMLSTNPVPTWVRDRFVQDKYGNPVSTKRNEKYVQFTIFDNPDDKFIQTYLPTLNKLKPRQRNRLLYGNWDFFETSDTIIYNGFDGDKNLVPDLMNKKYNPALPLIFVWDFNVIPQMSVLVCQVDYNAKEAYILDELAGTPKDKTNSTPAMSRMVVEYIKNLGHWGGVVISGDPTGKQRATASEHGVNNYTIIQAELNDNRIKHTLSLHTKAPSQSIRCEFVNALFEGSLGWKLFIDLKCRDLTNDILFQEQNPDGTKCKKKVTDPETGAKFEKYGHFSDNMDYFVTKFVPIWDSFANGGSAKQYSPQSIVSVKPRKRWGY